MNSTKKPLVLIILDGWGYSEKTEHNAIHSARTPVMDDLMKNRPSVLISTSGHDVGLPDGQMGNSEVGHVNIGAGRIVYQDLTRIDKAIEDGRLLHQPGADPGGGRCQGPGAGGAHHGPAVTGRRAQSRRPDRGHDQTGRRARGR
jgi:hypothetical protein